MPITADIMDHDFLGPLIRQSRREGVIVILRNLLSSRFGKLPAWIEGRLTNLSTSKLEDLSLRLSDAKTLEKLFVPQTLLNTSKAPRRPVTHPHSAPALPSPAVKN